MFATRCLNFFKHILTFEQNLSYQKWLKMVGRLGSTQNPKSSRVDCQHCTRRGFTKWPWMTTRSLGLRCILRQIRGGGQNFRKSDHVVYGCPHWQKSAANIQTLCFTPSGSHLMSTNMDTNHTIYEYSKIKYL